MFHHVCEFLKFAEELNPLPTHPSYFDEWYTDMENLWNSTGEAIPDEWYTVISLRKNIFDSSFLQATGHDNKSLTQTPSKSWEWLLTVDQMPQRTTDWYTQKRNMLTASEISHLWKGPRSRINLIASKSEPIKEAPSKRLAVLRSETNPMDWGVRYEPIVKLILEREAGTQVHELGRIQHRTIPGLAASPDGLYISGSKAGSLVEIKCPTTRVIEEKIPFDYWCQMQIQMEVCDIATCEYVEAKFKEDTVDATANANADAAEGYITLCLHDETEEMKYIYHTTSTCEEIKPWICIETYSWACSSMRRTIVERDKEWFKKMKPDISFFWKEVHDVREGRRILEPAAKKKGTAAASPELVKYSFVDE